MPQLKKVALAVGNTLIYTDTYEQALAQLSRGIPGQSAAAATQTTPAGTNPTPQQAAAPAGPPSANQASGDIRAAIRQHLQRYRDLTAQGKWSEAGKELEAVQSLVGK